MASEFSRRSALALTGAAALNATPALAAVATPAQTPGPFYPPPDERPADTDWDLVKVEGQVRAAGGDILHLAGRVLGTDGAAVAGARIEIWQCDVNGRYHHSGDRSSSRPLDGDFQGFGVAETGSDGGYRFRTIKPVAYPGRTPHIHARIVPREGGELVTQIYLSGEPLNQRDVIFRALGPEGQAAVAFATARRGDGDLDAEFDFIL